ncbi:NAD-dependent epimerase/dehydratase family protein [Sporosarcina sp. ANT_H38]|uniref:NAD-dependent epimerase/dehydratase family protein n=1 Tax=Sporosarcina sp. ANT_H38 TaxID=2597358 RepID=UPI0011F0B872|nr:NAD-dependent epimerase/dehydratase family protein [Sporosarcina sp. ANT_H38]KAA0948554.1 NAD-dependent epimerase/dehydratase family protein [Sporosarcina sp. ANT_H38]
MEKKTALIVGVTGLVGKELLQNLLQSEQYKQVITVVRKSLDITNPKLLEIIVDFEKLGYIASSLVADDIFCCLGTTIKKAKTKEAMYKVDVDYTLTIAKLAYANGAKQFLVISALSANPKSSIFYSKMKGELELKLARIPYESIAILRPSLLLGKRDEFRLAESITAAAFKLVPFIFQGPFKKYKAIEGKDIALAMYKIAQLNKPGVAIYPSEQLAILSQ